MKFGERCRTRQAMLTTEEERYFQEEQALHEGKYWLKALGRPAS